MPSTPTLRKDGRWQSRVYLGKDAQGEKHYHSVYAKSKRACERDAHAYESKYKGKFPTKTKTVGDLLELWLENTRHGVGENTLYRQRWTIQKHLLPTLGQIRLEQLTTLRVQAWVNRLCQCYKPGTVRSYLSVLVIALNYARRLKLLSENPCAEVVLPREDQHQKLVWTEAQTKRFLQVIEQDKDRILWLFGLYLGARIGEVLALRWGDLDLDQGLVHIQRTLTRTLGGHIEPGKAAKTRSSHRTLALPPNIVEVLRPLRGHPESLLFPNSNGVRRHPTTVHERLYRLQARAQVPRLTYHGLRRTYTTLQLDRGEDIKVISTSLGHTDIHITANVYRQVSRQAQQEAMLRLVQSLELGQDDSQMTQEEENAT